MPVNDPIYGVNPEETIALLKQRAFRLKQGRSIFDGRKIGLIITRLKLSERRDCTFVEGRRNRQCPANASDVRLPDRGVR